MNKSELHRVVNLIDYKLNAGFFISEDENDLWIQHFQRIPCTVLRLIEGNSPLQKGRKWRISKHMTQSEVVQTCLAAVLAFEEHEARENFTVAGQACYGPHLDVNALIDISMMKDIRGPLEQSRQREHFDSVGVKT